MFFLLCHSCFPHHCEKEHELKRKVKRDSKRQFNALHKNEFLFIASPSRKPMCIVFESTLSDNTRFDFSGHHKKHQVELEEKQKLVPGSELRKTYAVKKNRGYKRGKIHLFGGCESLAMLEASNKIAFFLVKKYGEDLVKPCLRKITKWVGDKVLKEK